MKITGLISVFFLLLTYTNVRSQDKPGFGRPDLDILRDRMTGEFSNDQQVKEDKSYPLMNLRLAQIWRNRKDGYWIYEEQAEANALRKPVWQRVYHLYLQDGKMLAARIYALPDAAKYAGAADNPALLDKVSAEMLISCNDCVIYFQKDSAGTYTGSTPGRDCYCNVKAAAFGKSEYAWQPEQVLCWNRAWNRAGRQIAGPEKGGYRYARVHLD